MSTLIPFPVQLALDPNGKPYPNARCETYISGTSTPAVTYADATLQTQHANPIRSTGPTFPMIFGPADTALKFVITDKDGGDAKTYDPVTPFSLTQAEVAAALFPQTAAEALAAVTIVNYQYETGDIRRYGAVVGVSNDSSDAIQAAVDVARASGSTGGVVKVPQGTFMVSRTISVYTSDTVPAIVSIQGSGKINSAIYASGFTQDQAIFNYGGTTTARYDGLFLRDLTLISSNGLARGLTLSYVVNSEFSGLYFYNLYRGIYADVSYSNTLSNCTSFLVTLETGTFNDDCNNWNFDRSSFRGQNGVRFTGHAHAIGFNDCDFEGITSATGAGIMLSPSTGKIVHSVNIEGCYFENIKGFAIATAGADAASVKGLTVKGNYITGGFTNSFLGVSGNATNAIKLYNVIGFSVTENYFEDWETNGFLLNGSEADGTVANNPGASTPNLANQAFVSSVHVLNNFAGRGESWSTTSPVGVQSGTRGDIVWNQLPSAGDKVGWVATVTGTPATWVPFGYSILEGTASYDPASLVAGTGFTTTVTVTGAALGDHVESVTFTLDTQGVMLFGAVSAANTVSIRFQNGTGSTVDLGAGTLKARVSKA